LIVNPLLPALAISAYLLGSVSFARITARLRAPGVDLTTVEYPVPGTEEVWVYRGVSATAVSRKIGFGWGFLVFLLDFLKGLLSTYWVRMMWPDETWYLVVGVFVVIGHVWPVWHRFVGGRGQSTAAGVVLAVNPVILFVAAGAGAVIGLLVFTSAHIARQSFGLYMWVWPLLAAGFDATFWFGLALSVVYLMAIRPDLREERRVKDAVGVADGYIERLQVAWREFVSTEE
jgi:glycerol-3-phosphate acyltransferase PlsY